MLLIEGLKSFLKAKNKMTQKESGYFLANLIGLNPKVQVAKIQAGIGQKDTESNDFQVTTEELEDFRKSLKYN